nr:GDSL-type esterase/lipase family protein [Streptomyces sp. SCUT-3]
MGRPARGPARQPVAGRGVPLRQPRGARQAARPDRRGPAPARGGSRPRFGDLLRGGQRHPASGSDPDDVAERLEAAVARLSPEVGTVLLCTGFDTRGTPVLRHLRGKIATYTAHVRAIADRHQCPVLDLWSLRSVQDRRAWSNDRLHLSPEGHTRVALRAAQVLGIDVPSDPDEAWPEPAVRPASEVRRENLRWGREHLVPWIGRRLRGESSGDHVVAKRPDLLPL